MCSTTGVLESGPSRPLGCRTEVHRGLAIVRMAAAEDAHVLTEAGGSLIVERFER